MKSGDYSIRNSLRQKIANAKGKYSSQFMNGDIKRGDLSSRKSLEEGVKMEGYEIDVNIKVVVDHHVDMPKSVSGHSEFWLG